MYLSKRVVGHTALGAGGPGSIPPWRALSKSLTFPSKSMINANIRPSELQKVTFWASDESLVRGLAQGPYFWCIGSPSGRPGRRAGVAQWLGPRPGRRSEAGGTRFDSQCARIAAGHDEPRKLGYVTSRKWATRPGIQTENKITEF